MLSQFPPLRASFDNLDHCVSWFCHLPANSPIISTPNGVGISRAWPIIFRQLSAPSVIPFSAANQSQLAVRKSAPEMDLIGHEGSCDDTGDLWVLIDLLPAWCRANPHENTALVQLLADNQGSKLRWGKTFLQISDKCYEWWMKLTV